MRVCLAMLIAVGCGTPADPMPDPVPTPDPVVEEAWNPARRLVGEIVFTYSALDPADTRETCSTTRTIDALEVQFLAEVACPDCRRLFHGPTYMDPTSVDCLDSWVGQVSFPPDRYEFWGWGPTGFFRSFTPFPGTPSAFEPPAEGETASLTWSGTNFGTVPYAFEAVTTMSWTFDETALIPDPSVRRVTPYTCGWPLNDPGDLEDPAQIDYGSTLPSGAFEDQCGEVVHLRDLAGRPTLFHLAEGDCDACVFVARAAWDRAQTTDLQIVTMFRGSDAEYEAAKITYGAFGPVLRNHGWAEIVGGWLSDVTPTAWWAVDADQTVLHAGIGTLDFSELDEVM